MKLMYQGNIAECSFALQNTNTQCLFVYPSIGTSYAQAGESLGHDINHVLGTSRQPSRHPSRNPFRISDDPCKHVHAKIQMEAGDPPMMDSSQVSPGPPISLVALRDCREILLRACSVCTGDDFPRLSCMISCVLNSVRPLHVTEAKEAVTIFTYAQGKKYSLSSPTPGEFTAWLQAFGPLFKIASDGHVSFGQQEMPSLLRNFRIQGIDASHRTIAMICARKIELEEDFEDWETVNSGEPGISCYAKHYWQHHYRIAQSSSLSLKFDRLEKEAFRTEVTSNLNLIPRCSTGPDTASVHNVHIGFEQLSLSERGQDWVVLEND